MLRSMRLSAALSETECDKIAAGQRARQSILYEYRFIRARMGAAIFDIARTLNLAAERQAGTGAMPVHKAPGSSQAAVASACAYPKDRSDAGLQSAGLQLCVARAVFLFTQESPCDILHPSEKALSRILRHIVRNPRFYLCMYYLN